MPPINVSRKYFGQIWRFAARKQTLTIVLHWTGSGKVGADTVEGAIRTLNTRDGGRLGYHYIIDRDGTVYQMADDTDIVYHAKTFSGSTLGIALVGTTDAELKRNPAQLNAAVNLVNQKLELFKLPKTAAFGHGELEIAYGRPGRKASDEGKAVLDIIRGTTESKIPDAALMKDIVTVSNQAKAGPGIPSQFRQGTSTTPTQPTTPSVASPSIGDAYKERVYRSPFRNGPPNIREALLLADTPARQYLDEYLNNLVGPNFNTPSGAVAQSQLLILDKPMFDGDVNLIDNITKRQQKRQDEVKSILSDKLRSFSPDAQYALLTNGIFEVYPDSMRNKMSKNSKDGGSNPNYSHAWRLPNKLSVTADMSIPGISGLRVGQIFWIDKLGDSYKDYGAFQLFGLTENIDISKGWTTSIHSRFIALPRRGGELYLTDTVKSGNTSQEAKEARPQNFL